MCPDSSPPIHSPSLHLPDIESHFLERSLQSLGTWPGFHEVLETTLPASKHS